MKYPTIKQVLVIISITLCLNLNVFSYICSNGAGTGYSENEGTQVMNSESIEMLVTRGAGLFLDAASSVDSMLKLYELQDIEGMDYNRFQLLTGLALVNMENTLDTYELLIGKAENTPYNQAILDKLAAFDYDAYQKRYNLNKSWFKRAAGFLKKGRITELFKYKHGLFTKIRDMLTSVQEALAKGELPALPLMWQLNECCTEASYMGSCTARVFYQVNR